MPPQKSRDGRDHDVVLREIAASFDEATIKRLAEQMLGAMCAAVPELAADPDLQAEVLAATRASEAQFLQSLDADPWIEREIPAPLAELARTMAARRLDVTVLIKLARVAQFEYWPALMEVVEQRVDDPSALRQALTALYERFRRYLEAELEGAIAAFQQERDRRMRGAQARRDEMIKALLDGEEVDVERACLILGHDLRAYQTALVLWDSGARQEPLDLLEAFARDFASALGARRVLTSASGSRAVWAWIATDQPLRPVDRERVAGLASPAEIRVTVGASQHGREGFVCSHREALAAHRLTVAGSGAPSVVWYADVELVSLLSHDEAGMRALISRELSGLTGTDRASARLRRTALAYVQHGCSATAAARELGAHKNTVRYRIRQVEDGLGRTLQGQELHLQLALMLVESLGDGLLIDAAARQRRAVPRSPGTACGEALLTSPRKAASSS